MVGQGEVPQNPQLQPRYLGVTWGQCVYFYRTLFPHPGSRVVYYIMNTCVYPFCTLLVL